MNQNDKRARLFLSSLALIQNERQRQGEDGEEFTSPIISKALRLRFDKQEREFVDIAALVHHANQDL